MQEEGEKRPPPAPTENGGKKKIKASALNCLVLKETINILRGEMRSLVATILYLHSVPHCIESSRKRDTPWRTRKAFLVYSPAETT